jgi:hypothetical protein
MSCVTPGGRIVAVMTGVRPNEVSGQPEEIESGQRSFNPDK